MEEFKVGDRVEIVKSGYSSKEAQVGGKGEVISVSKTRGLIKVRLIDGRELHYYNREIRKVEGWV